MKCPACDNELQTCPHCENFYCAEHGHIIGRVWDAINPQMCQEIQAESRASATRAVQAVLNRQK